MLVSLLASTMLMSAVTLGTAVADGNELNILYSGTPEVHEKEFLMDDYFAGFEEEFGAKVNVEFVTQADAISLIRTQQETGNVTYDVIYADTANMAPYVNGGWMEDITDLLPPARPTPPCSTAPPTRTAFATSCRTPSTCTC